MCVSCACAIRASLCMYAIWFKERGGAIRLSLSLLLILSLALLWYYLYIPDNSQMPPRCLPDGSQMTLRWFLFYDSFSNDPHMIPPPWLLLYDSSTPMSPLPWFLLHNSSSLLPLSRFFYDSSSMTPLWFLLQLLTYLLTYISLLIYIYILYIYIYIFVVLKNMHFLSNTRLLNICFVLLNSTHINEISPKW